MSRLPRRNVLVVTHLFPSRDTHSFTGAFVVEQIRALRAHCDVTVLVPYEVFVPALGGVRAAREVRTDGLDVWRVPVRLPLPGRLLMAVDLRLSRVWRRANRAVERRAVRAWNRGFKKRVREPLLRVARDLHARRSFDIVHGQEVLIGDEAVVTGRMLGVPSIVTLHAELGFVEDLYGPKCFADILKNLARADALTTVSERARRSYAGRLARPISIVPNGFSPGAHAPVSRAVTGFVRGRKVILFAGFLIPTKRVDLLVDAFHHLPSMVRDQAALVVVGTGPERARLERKVASLVLDQHVLFAGEVPPGEMGGYYAAADFVAQPSVVESFSMVCLEAMAYGKPFVCTSEAGIAEFVTDGGEAFVVPPGDVRALSAAIERLLCDDALRLEMGRRARERARRFEWPTVIRETLDVYDNLLVGRTRPFEETRNG